MPAKAKRTQPDAAAEAPAPRKPRRASTPKTTTADALVALAAQVAALTEEVVRLRESSARVPAPPPRSEEPEEIEIVPVSAEETDALMAGLQSLAMPEDEALVEIDLEAPEPDVLIPDLGETTSHATSLAQEPLVAEQVVSSFVEDIGGRVEFDLAAFQADFEMAVANPDAISWDDVPDTDAEFEQEPPAEVDLAAIDPELSQAVEEYNQREGLPEFREEGEEAAGAEEQPTPVETADDAMGTVSDDEIAALFAASAPPPAEPEVTVPEEADDDRKVLSEDEIHALLAARAPQSDDEPDLTSAPPAVPEPVAEEPEERLVQVGFNMLAEVEETPRERPEPAVALSPDPAALRRVAGHLAARALALPLRDEGERVVVAMPEPFDEAAIAELGAAIGATVVAEPAAIEAVVDGVRRHYSNLDEWRKPAPAPPPPAWRQWIDKVFKRAG